MSTAATITKVVQLRDDAAGNSAGWIPDPEKHKIDFDISDPDVATGSIVYAMVNSVTAIPCGVSVKEAGKFHLACYQAAIQDSGVPEKGSILKYIIISSII